jgi:hypothetical protein
MERAQTKLVVGFSSGISTMGDTCGVASGGVAVLGKRGVRK